MIFRGVRIGINLGERKAYFAEVAIHMQGLLYVNPKSGVSDNSGRLTKKFSKDIKYASQYYPDHDKVFMFWSPIVTAKGLEHIEEVKIRTRKDFSVELQLFVNQDFLKAVDELKIIAGTRTEELKSPVLRLFQIEEVLRRRFEKKELPKRMPASPSEHKWQPGSGTIGAYVKEYLEETEKPDYEELKDKVLKKYPFSKFNKSHYSWYRSQFKKVNFKPIPQ